MARSRGTWSKGNGAGHGGPRAGKGWGGAAKGEGREPWTAEDVPKGARTTEAIQAKIASREEVLELYTSIIRDQAEPTPNKINAGDKLLDRIEGKPIQKNVNENTTVRRVIRAPVAPASADEWMQQHRPMTKN